MRMSWWAAKPGGKLKAVLPAFQAAFFPEIYTEYMSVIAEMCGPGIYFIDLMQKCAMLPISNAYKHKIK